MRLLATTVTGNGLNLVYPWAAGQVVEQSVRLLDREGDTRPVVVAVMVLATVSIVTYLLMVVSGVMGQTTLQRVDGEVRRRIRTAASGRSGIAHLETEAFLNDVELLRAGILGQTLGASAASSAAVLGQYVTSIGATVILASFSAPLAAGYLVLTLLSRWRKQGIISRLTVPYVEQASTLRKASYSLDLAFDPQAAKEARVFGLGGWFGDRYSADWDRAMRPIWKVRQGLFTRVVVDTAMSLLPYGVIVAAIVTVGLGGELPVGSMVTYVVAAQLVQSLASIGASDGLQWGLPGVRALRNITAASASCELSAAVWPMRAAASSIRFDRLTFRYPGAVRPVLENLDLELRAGEATAIVGLNGAGKSTLVKLLAGLYEPTAGRILVDGHELTAADLPVWRSELAVIFQDFLQLPLTVRDNITCGAVGHAVSGEALARVAERAGTTQLIQALPAGWETVLSRDVEDGVELSGGQWQRVALARSLLRTEHGAHVLVLDEPTANLDVHAEAALVNEVLRMRRGATTILISHRFSTIRGADRIVVLDGGRVAEGGTHEELLAQGGRYASLFALQASRFRGQTGNDADADADGDADGDGDAEDEVGAPELDRGASA